MHAVVNEVVIQELFKFNFIGLLTLIGEYFYCYTWSYFAYLLWGSSFYKVLHQNQNE